MSEETTLYRFYDPEWRLLYVGISWNPRERFKAHSGDKAWWGYVSFIRVDHYATREAALQAETDTIREERPPFNTVAQNRYVREILQASRTVRPPAAPGRVSSPSTRPTLEVRGLLQAALEAGLARTQITGPWVQQQSPSTPPSTARRRAVQVRELLDTQRQEEA